MRSSFIYGADARPRKRGVATIADAIGMRRFAFRLDALRHRQGKSAHSPSGLVAPPRHERASSRHTKRHEIIFYPIPAKFQDSAKYAGWLMSNNSTLRSFRVISCRPLGPLSCLTMRQNPKGCFCETSWAEPKAQGPMATSGKCRGNGHAAFRVFSCAAKAAFRVRQATEPEGCFCEATWAEAKPQGPMATSGSRSPSGDQSRRRFSWSRVSAQGARVSANNHN